MSNRFPEGEKKYFFKLLFKIKCVCEPCLYAMIYFILIVKKNQTMPALFVCTVSRHTCHA